MTILNLFGDMLPKKRVAFYIEFNYLNIEEVSNVIQEALTSTLRKLDTLEKTGLLQVTGSFFGSPQDFSMETITRPTDKPKDKP